MADYTLDKRKPLAENEVIVHVPPGTSKHVKIVETEDAHKVAEITVQVSKKRAAGRVPVLGVIVK